MNKNETINLICDYLLKKHKDYILFIALVGSAAHNAMYAGVSDIDFIFITKGMDKVRNQDIMNFIRKNCTDFKIDTSFTSDLETRNCHCLNFKAMQGLYQVQKGATQSLYHNPSFTYKIDEEAIKNVARVDCLADITEVRRIVADFDNWPDKENGQRKLLKTTYYALKKYFILKDIFPKNVNDCLEKFRLESGMVLNSNVEAFLHKQVTSQAEFEKLKDFCFGVTNFLIDALNNREAVESVSLDIRVNVKDTIFKVRVCGIVENNGKYLLVDMGVGNYWCAPGGHVEWFENSEKAVVREVEEETGMKVEVSNLFLVHENFYYNVKNTKFHEIAFYYLLRVKKGAKIIGSQVIEEFDKGKKDVLKFKWFSKKEIENIELKPAILKEFIVQDKLSSLSHIIKRRIED